MNFEHLIQINDPENPLIEALNRDQVWQGLLYRVENPVPFLPGLESCTILERQANELLRELDFGPAVIRDRVTIAQGHSVRFVIEASEVHPGGSLHIAIEEPEASFLFLRFTYETTLANNPNSEDTVSYTHLDVYKRQARYHLRLRKVSWAGESLRLPFGQDHSATAD